MQTLAAASSAAPGRAGRSGWEAADVVFAAFLAMALVGLEPFAAREITDVAQPASGQGDAVRQASYLGAFAALALLSLFHRGVRGLAPVPVLLMLALGWMLMSTLWSIAPAITLRRAGLTAVVAWSVFLGAGLLGKDRALRALYVVLVCVLIVNLVSVLVVPHAVHLPGERDPGLIGNWRGLHYHKNIAGAVAALSGLLFLHLALEERRWRHWLLLVGALVFVAGSQSRTSLVLLAICIPVALLCRRAARSRARQRLFAGLCLWLLFLLLLAAVAFAGPLLDFLSDPAALTGRGAVWNLLLPHVAERPWLGAGHGAFWQSGDASPALLRAAGWAATTAHSHNGYLEILVTTGAIGLALALLSAVFLPAWRLLSFRAGRVDLLLPWLIFLVFQNGTETRLFQGSREEWVLHLILLALVFRSAPAARSGLQENPR